MSKDKKPLVDFHIHAYSFDAILTPKEVVKYSKDRGITYLSITDHNNLSGCRELYDQYNADYSDPVMYCDGVNLVSGVEVTCRVGSVLNYKGRTSKVHLLVYGADLSPYSPLSRLMDIKHQNDRDYDFGVLEYMLSLKPNHKITEKHIRDFIQDKRKLDPHYSTMSNSDIYEFLTLHGITVARSYKHFCELIKDAPKIERVNIDAKDLIKIAHASGGMVALAHPALNLRRTPEPKKLIQALMDAEIDGFEKFYNGYTAESNDMIADAIRIYRPDNFIFYSGGSDTHSFINGNTLGSFNGREQLEEWRVKAFLNEIKKLKLARLEGKKTHRTYNKCSQKDVEQLLYKYKKEALNARKGISDVLPSIIMPSHVYTFTKEQGHKHSSNTKKAKKAKSKNKYFKPDRSTFERQETVKSLREKETYEDYIRQME